MLWWVLGLVGSALAAVAYWAVRMYQSTQKESLHEILKRMDKQDAAIESLRKTLEADAFELRNAFHGLDLRLTRVESVCEVQHGVSLARHPINEER